RPGGVVWAGEQHDGGAPAADGGDRLIDVDCEVVPARCGAVTGERVPGVLGVHRVGGGEGQHAAPGPAEGLQQVNHHFVRAVAGPDVLRRELLCPGLGGEVLGEPGAQRREVPVRVAVQSA